MGEQIPGSTPDARERVRRHPRYIFQVARRGNRSVIRVLDTRTDRVFREVSAVEFVAFARKNRDVAQFFMRAGTAPGAAG